MIDQMNENIDFQSWIKSLNQNALSFWHESLAHMRHMREEYWKGIQLFIAVNGVVMAALITLMREDYVVKNSLVLLFLSLVGFGFTAVTFYVFRQQRAGYLEMVVQRTLIEKELGFYKINLQGIELHFPWSVSSATLPRLLKDPGVWQKKQMWKKRTGTRRLLYAFIAAMLIYSLIFTIILFVMILNWV